jgi:hypothetical protein
MGNVDRPTRTGGLAATATTLVALVAVAAAAPSVRGLPAARVVPVEILAPLNESEAMRALVGVVAAAARDLLARPQTTTALLPDEFAAPMCIECRIIRPASTTSSRPPTERLNQRLLDLPPPVC